MRTRLLIDCDASSSTIIRPLVLLNVLRAMQLLAVFT